MENKKCPVDRGKLLIALECCRDGGLGKCDYCPYMHAECHGIETDALAYIGYLEELVSIQEKEITRLRVKIDNALAIAAAALPPFGED